MSLETVVMLGSTVLAVASVVTIAYRAPIMLSLFLSLNVYGWFRKGEDKQKNDTKVLDTFVDKLLGYLGYKTAGEKLVTSFAALQPKWHIYTKSPAEQFKGDFNHTRAAAVSFFGPVLNSVYDNLDAASKDLSNIAKSYKAYAKK
jgi:hypothetical protein